MQQSSEELTAQSAQVITPWCILVNARPGTGITVSETRQTDSEVGNGRPVFGVRQPAEHEASNPHSFSDVRGYHVRTSKSGALLKL
jgi:hypothetical protein